MAFSQRDLKTLLAQGRLEQALAMLSGLMEHTDDAELRLRVLTLSGQFAALKQQHLTGLLEDKDYRLQWNRIAAAVADIADNLTPSETTHKRRWKKWAAIFVVLAGIAAITGYTLRDFLWPKQDPPPAVQQPIGPSQTDTTITAAPAGQPSEKAGAPGQNNVRIEVKDKAKVGNIITGDSNKIEIKQDF